MCYKVFNEDCFDWMENQSENTITAIVTDPPYGVKEYTEKELVKKEPVREAFGEYLKNLMDVPVNQFPDLALSMMIQKNEKTSICFLKDGLDLQKKFLSLADTFS